MQGGHSFGRLPRDYHDFLLLGLSGVLFFMHRCISHMRAGIKKYQKSKMVACRDFSNLHNVDPVICGPNAVIVLLRSHQPFVTWDDASPKSLVLCKLCAMLEKWNLH